MIEIKKQDIQAIQFDVVGTSPLICNRWSEENQKAILDKHMGKPKVKKFKEPDKVYNDSLYKMPSGGYGFPAAAFKKAAVRAAKLFDITMTDLRQMFFVIAEESDLVRIQGKPQKRKDMVRLNGKTPDVRFRGEFPTWKITLNVQYNAGVISAEQLVNLFEVAGFSVGVGEWRPEKSGDFGRFTLKTKAAKKAKKAA